MFKMYPSILLGVSVFVFAIAAAEDCNLRQIGENKMVCVCNKTNCDSIDIKLPTQKGQAIQVETSRSGKRLRVSQLSARPMRLQLTSAGQSSMIRVKLNEKYQTIMGWGGAFTDSTGLNVYNLSKPMAQKIIESYFGDQGLQYNFGRVPMGCADFSTRGYTYDDVADDYELKHFALAPEDVDLKIPMIKAAMALCEKRGEHLKLFGSIWSPPAWMKTTNSLVKGHLKDEDRVYRSYANYLIKFYQAYKEHGVKFWGQTLENEPIFATYPEEYLPSLEFLASEQIKFVTKYFGPALEANGMTKDKFKLMVGDDSLVKLMPLVPDVMNNPEAAKYFAGLAFHFYDSDHGFASRSNISVPYEVLENIYNKVADKIEFLIMTEACFGIDLGNWDQAAAYAFDIIQDLLRHTNAWIDWNLALNKAGGPNWKNLYTNSPIIVDEVNDEFMKQPHYYTLAHFSRFFRPGSVRVGTTIETKYDVTTAAVRDDSTGHLMVNILNRSDKDQTVELMMDDGLKYKPIDVEAKSIMTVVVKM